MVNPTCPLTAAENVLQLLLVIETVLLILNGGGVEEKQRLIVVPVQASCASMQYLPYVSPGNTPVELQVINTLLLSNKQKLGLKKFVAPFTVAVNVLQLLEDITIALTAGVITRDVEAFLTVPQRSFATISKLV